MEITLTELKGNLGKYVMLSQKEDSLITKNDKIISQLTEPFTKRKETIRKRKGLIQIGIPKEDFNWANFRPKERMLLL